MKKKTIIILSLIFLLLLVTSVNAIPDDGLFRWDFEEGSGTNVSDSWNDYDGTSNGMAWNSTVPSFNISGDGGSYSGQFDGLNDILSKTSEVTITPGNFSLSLWFRIGSLSTYKYLVFKDQSGGNNHDFSIYLDNSGNVIKAQMQDGSSQDVLAYTPTSLIGEWHQIVFTSDGSTSHKLYVDGSEEDTSSLDWTLAGNTLTWYFGSWNGANAIDGLMDEIELYNSTLDSTSVSNLYNYGNITGVGEAPANTVPYFTINAPLGGAVNISINPYLNLTVFDSDLDSLNISFYNKTSALNSFNQSITDLSSASPLGLEDSGGTYDSENDVFLIFGGDPASGVNYKDTIQMYNKSSNSFTNLGSNLPIIDGSGQLPTSDSCIYSPIQKKHYCFGGEHGSTSGYTTTDRIWWYDYNTNTSEYLNLNLTEPSSYGCAVYDSKRDLVYQIGGYNNIPSPDELQKTIEIINLTSNTSTFNVNNLTKCLVDPGCAYDPIDDVVYVTGGTSSDVCTDADPTYWNRTIAFYPSNGSVVTLSDTSNLPYVGADSLTCDYMPVDGNIYCFGNIFSSIKAPYTYRDDILMFNTSTLVWSILSETLLDDDEDFPCALDTSVNNSIYCFNLLQASSSDNDISRKTETVKFSVDESYTDSYSLMNTTTGLSNGSIIAYPWVNLSYSTMYYWTFNLTDGTSINSSELYNFTTLANPSTTPTFTEALSGQTISHSVNLEYDINCSDADGDTVTYYDNTSLFNINSSTGLISDNPIQSEAGVYHIRINCSDGTNQVTSTFVYTITNTAPTINFSSIYPSVAYTNTNLLGYCMIDDADGDNITMYYQWWIGATLNSSGSVANIVQGTNHSLNNISSSWTSKGEVWTLSCLGDDNAINSTWTNSTPITISNTAPTLPTQNSPASAGTITSNSVILDCSGSTDVDSDDITYYYHGDSSDGSTLLGVNDTGTSYNWTGLLDDTTYFWKCLANDGTSNSSFTSVLNFTTDIEDVPVTVLSNITPGTVYTNTTLLGYCNVSDGDGDGIIYYYSWYKNGVNISQSDSRTRILQEVANETSQTSGGTQGFLYSNYTKESNYQGAIWQVKHGTLDAYNISLPSECFNQNDSKLVLRMKSGQTGGYYYSEPQCYNGTDWKSIGTQDNTTTEIGGAMGDIHPEYLNDSDYSTGVVMSYSHPIYTWATVSAIGGVQGMTRGQIFEEGIYWINNNTLTQGVNTNIDNLSSSNFDKNDNITFSCRGYDGTSYSDWTNSTTKTISNLAPTTNIPTITPSTAYTNNTLLGYCQINDTDGDTQTIYYQWWLNNVLNNTGSVAGQTQGVSININNISSLITSKEQNWTLSCLGNDGVINSSWVNSTQLTISNIAPYTNWVNISPIAPQAINNLTFLNNTIDNDLDTITSYEIRWYVNDTINNTYNNSLNISSTLTNNDETWKISLRAYDGTDWSAWVNSSAVTIGDSVKPVLQNDSLSASSGTDDTPFTIYVNVTDGSTINWTIVQITDPNSISTNFSMTQVGSTIQYSKTYTPGTDGVYSFKFYSQDVYGNEGNLTSALTYTESTSTPPPAGGGGGVVIDTSKEDCNININPSIVFITQGEKLQEIAITNNDDLSVDFTYEISSDSQITKERIIISNPTPEILPGQEESFGVKFLTTGLGDPSYNGSANIILVSNTCNDIIIPVRINLEQATITEVLETFTIQNILDLSRTNAFETINTDIARKIPLLTYGVIYLFFLLLIFALSIKSVVKTFKEKNNLLGLFYILLWFVGALILSAVIILLVKYAPIAFNYIKGVLV